MIAQGGIVNRGKRLDKLALLIEQIQREQLRFAPVGVIALALELRRFTAPFAPSFSQPARHRSRSPK